MKIINLIEDTPGAEGLLFEHGLCFYIETAHHRVLLDTGATGAFLQNAARLGVDLAAVDTVVISHGHYDHAGGLLSFAKINPCAVVYIQKSATGAFYNLKNGGTKYIGMDAAVATLPQVRFIEGDLKIDEELAIFSGVTARRLSSRGNAVLRVKKGEDFAQDSFSHEQYLVVFEGERRVLLSGCAHNGILNILDAYRARFSGFPTHVISGFHTVMPTYDAVDDALIEETARELASMPALFYTGHCTGEYAMNVLANIMGERLCVLHSGDTVLEN